MDISVIESEEGWPEEEIHIKEAIESEVAVSDCEDHAKNQAFGLEVSSAPLF